MPPTWRVRFRNVITTCFGGSPNRAELRYVATRPGGSQRSLNAAVAADGHLLLQPELEQTPFSSEAAVAVALLGEDASPASLRDSMICNASPAILTVFTLGRGHRVIHQNLNSQRYMGPRVAQSSGRDVIGLRPHCARSSRGRGRCQTLGGRLDAGDAAAAGVATAAAAAGDEDVAAAGEQDDGEETEGEESAGGGGVLELIFCMDPAKLERLLTELEEGGVGKVWKGVVRVPSNLAAMAVDRRTEPYQDPDVLLDPSAIAVQDALMFFASCTAGHDTGAFAGAVAGRATAVAASVGATAVGGGGGGHDVEGSLFGAAERTAADEGAGGDAAGGGGGGSHGDGGRGAREGGPPMVAIASVAGGASQAPGPAAQPSLTTAIMPLTPRHTNTSSRQRLLLMPSNGGGSASASAALHVSAPAPAATALSAGHSSRTGLDRASSVSTGFGQGLPHPLSQPAHSSGLQLSPPQPRIPLLSPRCSFHRPSPFVPTGRDRDSPASPRSPPRQQGPPPPQPPPPPPHHHHHQQQQQQQQPQQQQHERGGSLLSKRASSMNALSGGGGGILMGASSPMRRLLRGRRSSSRKALSPSQVHPQASPTSQVHPQASPTSQGRAPSLGSGFPPPTSHAHGPSSAGRPPASGAAPGLQPSPSLSAIAGADSSLHGFQPVAQQLGSSHYPYTRQSSQMQSLLPGDTAVGWTRGRSLGSRPPPVGSGRSRLSLLGGAEAESLLPTATGSGTASGVSGLLGASAIAAAAASPSPIIGRQRPQSALLGMTMGAGSGAVGGGGGGGGGAQPSLYSVDSAGMRAMSMVGSVFSSGSGMEPQSQATGDPLATSTFNIALPATMLPGFPRRTLPKRCASACDLGGLTGSAVTPVTITSNSRAVAFASTLRNAPAASQMLGGGGGRVLPASATATGMLRAPTAPAHAGAYGRYATQAPVVPSGGSKGHALAALVAASSTRSASFGASEGGAAGGAARGGGGSGGAAAPAARAATVQGCYSVTVNVGRSGGVAPAVVRQHFTAASVTPAVLAAALEEGLTPELMERGGGGGGGGGGGAEGCVGGWRSEPAVVGMQPRGLSRAQTLSCMPSHSHGLGSHAVADSTDPWDGSSPTPLGDASLALSPFSAAASVAAEEAALAMTGPSTVGGAAAGPATEEGVAGAAAAKVMSLGSDGMAPARKGPTEAAVAAGAAYGTDSASRVRAVFDAAAAIRAPQRLPSAGSVASARTPPTISTGMHGPRCGGGGSGGGGDGDGGDEDGLGAISFLTTSASSFYTAAAAAAAASAAASTPVATPSAAAAAGVFTDSGLESGGGGVGALSPGGTNFCVPSLQTNDARGAAAAGHALMDMPGSVLYDSQTDPVAALGSGPATGPGFSATVAGWHRGAASRQSMERSRAGASPAARGGPGGGSTGGGDSTGGSVGGGGASRGSVVFAVEEAPSLCVSACDIGASAGRALTGRQASAAAAAAAAAAALVATAPTGAAAAMPPGELLSQLTRANLSTVAEAHSAVVSEATEGHSLEPMLHGSVAAAATVVAGLAAAGFCRPGDTPFPPLGVAGAAGEVSTTEPTATACEAAAAAAVAVVAAGSPPAASVPWNPPPPPPSPPPPNALLAGANNSTTEFLRVMGQRAPPASCPAPVAIGGGGGGVCRLMYDTDRQAAAAEAAMVAVEPVEPPGPFPEGRKECWHEVWATRAVDPVTGEAVLVLAQHDITAKVVAERHLALVMETEHRLLEQLFPRHILAYITEEWTCEALRAALAPPRPEGTFARTSGGQLTRPAVRDCTALATWHDQVTLLFADIKGFTPMCKQVEPRQVMSMLNDLYSRYDKLLDKYGVFKVETIGDCYFVAGGLMHEDEDGMVAVRGANSRQDPLHARKVFMFAKAMLEAAKQVKMPTNGEPVQIRIGIATGPVVSGVVGQRMPRFCLFGDTVNTASRMESTGLPGAIHVSQATYELLRDEAWTPTGGIEVKGKGLMQTYLWQGSPELEMPLPPDVAEAVAAEPGLRSTVAGKTPSQTVQRIAQVSSSVAQLHDALMGSGVGGRNGGCAGISTTAAASGAGAGALLAGVSEQGLALAIAEGLLQRLTAGVDADFQPSTGGENHPSDHTPMDHSHHQQQQQLQQQQTAAAAGGAGSGGGGSV